MLSVHLGVRLKPEEKKLLQLISDARGEDVSSFVRRSVFKELAFLNLLPADQVRALGLQANSMQGIKQEVALHGQHNKNMETEDDSQSPSESRSPATGDQNIDTRTGL